MTSADDERWMRLAVELAWRCPPSRTAYSVGAVIVAAGGAEVSRGFSREDDPLVHAEESALRKLPPGDPRLAGATIYSTLEPCSRRKSRPRTCTELIIAAGLRRVVIAWREPDLFVANCQGAELLAAAGLAVDELPGLAEQAAAPNRHLAFLSPERTRATSPRAPLPPPGRHQAARMRHFATLVTSEVLRCDRVLPAGRFMRTHRATGEAAGQSDDGDKGALMETMPFTALCERAGRWWTIRIPQLEGLTAQARTLDQVEMMSRQVVARHLGVAPESVSVEVIPDAPPTVAQALQARHAARQAVEAAAIATRAALEALAAEGHTFPDAATMLGLTPAEIDVYRPLAGGASPVSGWGPLQPTGR